MKRLIRFFSALMPVLIPVLLMSQESQSEALYHRLSKTYTLNPDGSMEYTYTKEQTLLTYTAFHRLYGETFIIYNPDYQKLEILEAYTKMVDGKRIQVPENAFNEVLPRFANRVPAWNNLREMVITHTGLERGATIFLSYSILTKPGYYPALMGTEIFSESEPVDELSISVRVPSGQKLYSKVRDTDLQPSVTEQNGYSIYRWDMKDVPAHSAERFQSPDHCNEPGLVFSTEKGYDRILGIITSQPAFRQNTGNLITRFTDTIVAGKETLEAKAFAIQEAVVQNLNLYQIPDYYTGYRIRTPDQVIQSNGGTFAEKALLMTEMLRLAGLEASPVLVFPSCTFDREIGNLSALGNWIVRTSFPEAGTIYLAVDQINAYSMNRLMPGQVFLDVTSRGGDKIEEIPGQRSVIRVKGTLQPDTALRLNGDLFAELEGRANPYLALLRSEKKAGPYLGGSISSRDLSLISLTSLTPDQAKLTLSVKGASSLKTDAGFLFVEIPYLRNGFSGWGISYLEKKRQADFILPYTLSEHYEYTLILPEGWEYLSSGTEPLLRNSAGTFIFDVKQSGNMLTVTKSIDIPGSRIETENYPDLKVLVDQWNLPEHNRLIFRK